MAQRMITIKKVRTFEEKLRENKKVGSTLDKLLMLDDLSPPVLRHTKLEEILSKLLLTKHRNTAFAILKRIRRLKNNETVANTVTPLRIIRNKKNFEVCPPPPVPPSIEMMLATKDAKNVLDTIQIWLNNEKKEDTARAFIDRLRCYGKA